MVDVQKDFEGANEITDEYTSQSVTIGQWTVTDGYLYREDIEKPIRGDYYREISTMEERTIIRKIGGDPKDYVRIGNALVTREVALAAKNQWDAIKKAKQARFDKNVPGLRELERAIEYDDEQREIAQESIHSGCGILRGNLLSNTAAELRIKYPCANAYLRARAYADSANIEKASLGRTAMKKIAEGENYDEAIAEMELGWNDYVDEHVWD